MNCKNCGNPIDEGMRFCMNCGTPVDTQGETQAASQTTEAQPTQPEVQEVNNAEQSVQPQPVEQPPQPQQSFQAPVYQPQQQAPAFQGQPVYPVQPQPKSSKKTVGIIIGAVCAVVVLAVIAIILIVSKAGKVNPANYINDNISAVGYNGYAVVYDYDVVDYYSLADELDIDDYYDYDYDDDYYDDYYDDDYYYSDGVYAISDYITVVFDKSEYLSNGDVVTATIYFNYDAINAISPDKKLSGKESYTVEYKISGLTEVDVFDPFNAVKDVAYFEADDWAQVTLDPNFTDKLGDCTFSVSENEIDIYYKNEYVSSINIYVSTEHYSKSGQVTLETSCFADDYSDKYGFVVGPETKKVEPSVYKYLMENKVNDADYKLIKAAADKMIANDSYYENPVFYSAYFACNDAEAYDKNAIVLVYSYDSNWNDGATEYMAYIFEDFSVNSETNSIYFDDVNNIYVYEDALNYESAKELFRYYTNDYQTVEELSVQ